MKILFTGHRGFLGRELIPPLSAKTEIIIFKGDLLNYSQLAKFAVDNSISRIIHAAAKVSNRWDTDTSNNLIENLKMTTNILNLGVPTLTFCSGKIYGYQDSIDNAAEYSAGSKYPEDFYGQGKYIIRKLVEDNGLVSLLRYFNVFGSHEDKRKFVMANLTRYLNKQPMIVDQNIVYDFFYVQDTLPIIFDWIHGRNIPKETNLVYKDKLNLYGVCEMINKLDNHKVDIVLQKTNFGKNFSGNGEVLLSLGYQLIGLEEGLKRVYSEISVKQSY
jgi:nucleoside-diphosphate-sugar epimerase